MGWFTKLLIIGVVGYGGYYVYNLNRAGYLALPDLPTGAYPISFESGFRGVVYDMEVTDDQYENAPKIFRRLTMANPDRRFIGLPSDVPRWFEDTWFALKKLHVIDFVLRNRGFSSLRPQGFVCLWLKPCNFGSGHEAPSPP